MVFVVEDHNEALPLIYRQIGRKRLPFSNCCLLHFDSHSDLSIPKTLNADQIFETETLFSTLSIENWIIPSVFAGHVSTIVWIKPFWTKDSFEPYSQFNVGKHVESGEIRVTSKSNYFLSELSYASDDDIVDSKPLTLLVFTFADVNLCRTHEQSSYPFSCNDSHDEKVIHMDERMSQIVELDKRNIDVTNSESSSPNKPLIEFDAQIRMYTDHSEDVARKYESYSNMDKKYQSETNADVNKGYQSECDITLKLLEALQENDLCGLILDIDLDFFSTADPFRAKLTEKQLHLMKCLYHYVPPVDNSKESLGHCLEKRQTQLVYLKRVMKCIQNGEPVFLGESQRDEWIKELLDDLKNSSSSIDYEWLHEIGTGYDDCPLPHHISSKEEIKELINGVKKLLHQLPQPSVITISRSSCDDYCPFDQVEYIEENVLSMLHSIYGNHLDLHLLYKMNS